MSDVSAPALKRDAGGIFARVLVVDGNDRDRESLTALLARGEVEVTPAASGREAQACLDARTDLDAVILDPALPDADGMELIRRISGGGAPIFVLSNGHDDGVADLAYANGATDFSYKPVVRNELLARLRKVIGDRRPAGSNGATARRIRLDRTERRCVIDDRTFSLTRHERDFLACLMDSPRGFASYEEIIAAVWGPGKAVETQYLRVLAAQVRRKLGDTGGLLIQTVAGEGFKLNS